MWHHHVHTHTTLRLEADERRREADLVRQALAVRRRDRAERWKRLKRQLRTAHLGRRDTVTVAGAARGC